MTSVDWDEIKRLAADFQKAQLSSTLQQLSERNCVEIITKLIELNLLDVIFTLDGKEYITPQHLEKEIRDELYMHGGRINLVELTKILTVDLSHISKIANEIEKHDKGVKQILGQLIDKSYTIKILGEINDKLSQTGYINVAELTLHYDLPAEYLQSLIEKALGKTVHGTQDTQEPRVFYTEAYIARNKAIIRGALSAITLPTPITAILGLCNVPERIFFSLVDGSHGLEIPGVITGKQGHNATYIPTIYSKLQSDWVNNFYKQNGYLEYDAVTRLGISDAKTYIRRHFPQEELTFLDTVAVGPALIDQVDANVEEAIATSSYVDLYPLLPSVFTPEDVELLLKDALKRSAISFHIFATTVIVSETFLQKLCKPLEAVAEAKAKQAVESGKWLQHVAEKKIQSSTKVPDNNKVDRKDERRKKASGGKAGGGNQGRETKTKSTKKKYHQGKNHDHDYDSDDDMMKSSRGSEKSELILITSDNIKNELKKYHNFSDVEDLEDQLADYLQIKLNKLSLSIAEQLGQRSQTNNLTQVEERLNMLITNIKMFEKGTKCISDKESFLSLSKYLMKSLGVDFINELLKLASQQNITQCPNNLTTEARQKMLLDLPEDVKIPLDSVHKAVTKGSMEDFMNAVDSAMAACCLVLRKTDKRKEKSLVLDHRQALLEKLNETVDPALALHLTTSVLFTAATQSALHMSGRHVSVILTFLQPYLVPAVATMLSRYHDLVLELLSTNDPAVKEQAQKSLQDGIDELKNIAINFKKNIISDKLHE